MIKWQSTGTCALYDREAAAADATGEATQGAAGNHHIIKILLGLYHNDGTIISAYLKLTMDAL
jgi:hypothetical protein